MVGGGSFLVLTMTLVASVFDARLGDQNARTAEHLRTANAQLQARAEALARQMTAETREAEARLRAVFDSALDCIIAMDAEGRILDFNLAAERTFGYARAAVAGAKLADTIIPPAYRERHAKGLERYLTTGENSLLGKRIEITATRADGSEFPIELAITVTAIGGKPVFTAHLRDLTTRRMAEQSLRLRGLAIESSVNGILIVNHRDPDCPIEYANPAFRRITGYTADEIVGCNFERLLRTKGEDGAEMGKVREGLRLRREVRVLLHNYRKDGGLFWNDLFIAPVLDGHGDMTHSVMIVHDVSAVIAQQDDLRKLANHDALTGLPNRILFGERLARVIVDSTRERRRFIVLFADVDELKYINDTLGHTAGDELLRNVATRLQSCLRADDTIARLGGDEFVIALTRTDLGDAGIQAIVERLQSVVAEPMIVSGRELRVTCSIGVSRFPEDGKEAVDLLKHADQAMYRAKRVGRSSVH
jgi:diguanylate cyclase (GGDEF)-like protein/PAS domain S-box-containing protein